MENQSCIGREDKGEGGKGEKRRVEETPDAGIICRASRRSNWQTRFYDAVTKEKKIKKKIQSQAGIHSWMHHSYFILFFILFTHLFSTSWMLRLDLLGLAHVSAPLWCPRWALRLPSAFHRCNSAARPLKRQDPETPNKPIAVTDTEMAVFGNNLFVCITITINGNIEFDIPAIRKIECQYFVHAKNCPDSSLEFASLVLFFRMRLASAYSSIDSSPCHVHHKPCHAMNQIPTLKNFHPTRLSLICS